MVPAGYLAKRVWVPTPGFGWVSPAARQLEGFDVVSANSGWVDCSPLTCNRLAEEIETDARALLPTLERARLLLESGVFRNSEPGPYRIVAVYTLPSES